MIRNNKISKKIHLIKILIIFRMSTQYKMADKAKKEKVIGIERNQFSKINGFKQK